MSLMQMGNETRQILREANLAGSKKFEFSALSPEQQRRLWANYQALAKFLLSVQGGEELATIGVVVRMISAVASNKKLGGLGAELVRMGREISQRAASGAYTPSRRGTKRHHGRKK